ncbi:MAG TPA: hypothetical protein DEA08_19485, partial [Planctomycetes bacterium]|nr:hypothetical protein [Planctomycetota bacterium]
GQLEASAAKLEGLWAEGGERAPELEARAEELRERLEAARSAREERLEEVRGLFAQGATLAARALLKGLPAFPERPWILALSGDYAEALAAAGEAAPAERARLAAWARDGSALSAALA